MFLFSYLKFTLSTEILCVCMGYLQVITYTFYLCVLYNTIKECALFFCCLLVSNAKRVFVGNPPNLWLAFSSKFQGNPVLVLLICVATVVPQAKVEIISTFV